MSRKEALNIKRLVENEVSRRDLEKRQQRSAELAERAEKERQRQKEIEAIKVEARRIGVVSLFEALRDEEVVVGRKHEEVQVGMENGKEKSIWKYLTGSDWGRYERVPAMKDKFEPAKIDLGLVWCDNPKAEEGGVYLPGVTLKFDFWGRKPKRDTSDGDWGWSEINAYLNTEGKLMINDVEVKNNLNEVVKKAILDPRPVRMHQEERNAPG